MGEDPDYQKEYQTSGIHFLCPVKDKIQRSQGFITIDCASSWKDVCPQVSAPYR